MAVQRTRKEAGFTVIELMVVVAIVAIIVGLAYPSFSDLLERMRLRAAAEAIYSELHYARSETLKTKVPHDVWFVPGAAGAWCVGVIAEDPAGTVTSCDCTAVPTDCDRVVDADDFPNVRMTEEDSGLTFGILGGGVKGTSFEPMRGRAKNAGTAMVRSPAHEKSVVVSTIGRVRVTDGHYSF